VLIPLNVQRCVSSLDNDVGKKFLQMNARLMIAVDDGRVAGMPWTIVTDVTTSDLQQRTSY